MVKGFEDAVQKIVIASEAKQSQEQLEER